MALVDKIFSSGKEINLQEILNTLLDAQTNLELKSHVKKPTELARLKLISDFLKDTIYEESGGYIDSFITIYLKYMVSYDRLSRKEVIEAISSTKEVSGLSTAQKLTTNLKT